MLKTRPEAVITAMLAAAGMLPLSAKANTTFTEGGKYHIYTLHTHLVSHSLDLSPQISSKNKEYKTAAVCFISDTSACSDNQFGGNGDSDFDLNDRDRCYKEGYTITDCPDGYKPGGKCPYGPYYSECVSICPSGYKTCEPPYYGVGEACDGKYASCEKDTERACKELDPEFTDTCQDGWKVDPNNVCEYDPTYGKCCNLCIGYDYTSIPEGYEQVGEGCLDCDGQTKYKVTEAACDGFQECGDLGPVFGTETCLSGTTTLYKECKTCPNIGEYSSSSPECSAPFKCTLEDCSGKYYQSGCVAGFIWDEAAKTCTCEGVDWCAITPSCTDLGYKQQTCNGPALKCPFDSDYTFCTGECSPLFKYTCTGIGYAGGVGAACGGKYAECTCTEGYVWRDGVCIENKAEWGQCSGYASQCSIGDIVFSDRTCSANMVSGKTPIAVVVYKSSDGNCGQAMALKSTGKYIWGGFGTNIPELTEYTNIEDARNDFLSRDNSAIIRAAGNNSTYPAVWEAYYYTTWGTTIGDWCLPAAGVLASYYNNKSVIDKALTNAGGTTIGLAWSSSEYGSNLVWLADGTDINVDRKDYSDAVEVRPVIEF